MQDETINNKQFSETLKDSIEGDLSEVMKVLQDIKKTIEFAVEFEGQQIYINKGVSRKLKQVEMILEYNNLCKIYPKKEALRKVARMYNFTVVWTRKIIKECEAKEREKQRLKAM